MLPKLAFFSSGLICSSPLIYPSLFFFIPGAGFCRVSQPVWETGGWSSYQRTVSLHRNLKLLYVQNRDSTAFFSFGLAISSLYFYCPLFFSSNLASFAGKWLNKLWYVFTPDIFTAIRGGSTQRKDRGQLYGVADMLCKAACR